MQIISNISVAALIAAALAFASLASIRAWHMTFDSVFFIDCLAWIMALLTFYKVKARGVIEVSTVHSNTANIRVVVFWSVIAAAIALTVFLIRLGNAPR